MLSTVSHSRGFQLGNPAFRPNHTERKILDLGANVISNVGSNPSISIAAPSILSNAATSFAAQLVPEHITESVTQLNKNVAAAQLTFDKSVQRMSDLYSDAHQTAISIKDYTKKFAVLYAVNMGILFAVSMGTGAGIPAVGGWIVGSLLMTAGETVLLTKIQNFRQYFFGSPKQIEDLVKKSEQDPKTPPAPTAVVAKEQPKGTPTTPPVSQQPSQFDEQKLEKVEQHLLQATVSNVVPVQTFDSRTGEVLPPETPTRKPLSQKYEENGFSAKTNPTMQEELQAGKTAVRTKPKMTKKQVLIEDVARTLKMANPKMKGKEAIEEAKRLVTKADLVPSFASVDAKRSEMVPSKEAVTLSTKATAQRGVPDAFVNNKINVNT